MELNTALQFKSYFSHFYWVVLGHLYSGIQRLSSSKLRWLFLLPVNLLFQISTKFNAQMCELVSKGYVHCHDKFSVCYPLVEKRNASIFGQALVTDSDSTYNRVYFTLIHCCVRFLNLLTRTYCTLRVFRLDIFLPVPSFHQSTNPMLLLLLFWEFPKRIKRGTWLMVNYSPNP